MESNLRRGMNGKACELELNWQGVNSTSHLLVVQNEFADSPALL